MEKLRQIVHYLLNLQWTEKVQHNCLFCDRNNFKSIVYEDDTVIAIDNHRNAGRTHWLIMPKGPAARHIRDIEALTSEDMPLLQQMNAAKEHLLRTHHFDTPRSAVHSGYHRGRRTLVGSTGSSSIIVLPDIVSVHHLHLHVIVEPRPALRLFKYPSWLRWMWLSDQKVMAQTVRRRKPRMAPKVG